MPLRQREGQNEGADTPSKKLSTAYLQEFAKVPQAACQYIDELLADYHPNTAYVFKHVLNSGRLKPDQKGWVPVPSRLVQRKKPQANLRQLVRDGLLEMIPHDLSQGRAREYRVSQDLRRTYFRITQDNLDGPKVNLFSSTLTTCTQRSTLSDESNNSYPELVDGALRTIRRGYFNRRAVRRHLDELREQVEDAKRAFENAKRTHDEGSGAFRRARKKYQTALSRHGNDLRCYETLEGQAAAPSGRIVPYHVAYRPQMSGRLTQVGGGTQSASRAMKEAIYEGVEGVRNYDIRSSQALILVDFLHEAGISPTWVEDYVSTRDAKRKYAARAGLSVDAWKACLYALLMGATLPQNVEASEGSIRDEIEDDVGRGRLTETYRRFRKVVDPLYATLKGWHDYLVGPWYSMNSDYGDGGARYVRNDTGMAFTVDTIERPDKRKAKLAAFLLQGREAAFIHALTLEAAGRGIEVISNEHDGLVTIGEIPQEAIDAVRLARGMPYIELPEKSFT